MFKKLIRLTLPLLLLALATATVTAAPPWQAPNGEEYTVQAGDFQKLPRNITASRSNTPALSMALTPKLLKMRRLPPSPTPT